MRIISGKYGGRTIPSVNLQVRPTTDFAKEGLFNVLNNIISFDNLSCLDLFAGTGNIGYELVSRGASELTFVEMNEQNILFIKKNMQKLEIKYAKIIRNDVFRFLGFCKEKYDFIFADPPFEMERIELIPKIIFEKNLLNKNGVFVLEHSAKHSFTHRENFADCRKYGKVHFSIFRLL